MTTPQQRSPPPPVIPESWLTISEQRIYVAGFFGLMQAYKLTDVFFYLYQSTLSTSPLPPPSTFLSPLILLNRIPGSSFIFPAAEASSSAYLVKWLLWDTAIVLLIPRLRIPDLWYGWGRTMVYMSLLGTLDFLLLGKFHVWASIAQILAALWHFANNPFGKIRTLSESMSSVIDVLNAEQHLLGSLTIDIKPSGHAQLNPLFATYCLPSTPSEPVYIPILTNNSSPELITYRIRSHDALGFLVTTEHTVPASKLKQHKRADVVKHADIFDAEDDEDALDLDIQGKAPLRAKDAGQGQPEGFDPLSAVTVGGGTGSLAHRPSIRSGETIKSIPRQLERTQQVWYLAINKPGVVDIIKIQDEDGYPFRLKRSPGALVIECPGEVLVIDPPKQSTSMVLKKAGKGGAHLRCLGDKDVVEMSVKGVGTMSVGWRIVEIGGGKSVEEGVIEGIETPEAGEETELEDVGAENRKAIADEESSERAGTHVKSDGTENKERQLILKDDQWTRPPAFSQAQTHPVYLPVFHNRPGTYDVQLHTVTDSLNNVYHPPVSTAHRTFEVHSRPSVQFSTTCSPTKPIKLLEGGSANLPIQVQKDDNDVKLDLKLSFRPIDTGVGSPWTKDIQITGRATSYTVDEPGIYIIEEVSGQVCSGTVKEPSSCIVKSVPKPSVRVTTTAVQDCGVDVGIRTKLDMSGTPPFTIAYSIFRQGEKRPKVSTRICQSITEEITLKPGQEGQYEYKFIEIHDANYKNVPISAPPYLQTVHPVARVEMVGRKERRKLWTCVSNSTSIDVAVSGTVPILVSYNIAWPGTSIPFSKQFEKAGTYTLPIEIPQALREEAGGGGSFSVVVHTTKDGNGCEKHVDGVTSLFDVQTARPSARFGNINEMRSVSLVEGRSEQVPVRLTGDAPWTIRYRLDSGSPQIQKLALANSHLAVDKAGHYELLEVVDSHCPGNVIEESATFDVSLVPRPSVALAPDAAVAESGGKLRRKGVCAGVEDQVTLALTGHGPFEVKYTHTRTPLKGSAEVTAKTLRSAQESGVLHLATTPGHHSYDIAAVGDSSYPLAPKGKSRSVFKFEQDVYSRPRATFKKSSRASYCLNEHLTRKSDNPPRISFEGQAPFSVDVLITQPGHRTATTHPIRDITTKDWHLELSTYKFTAVGMHTFVLQNVQDSSGCTFELLEDDLTTIGIDVVEPAAIVSVDRKENYCVGDLLEFVLQGTAPWTISYSWNGKVQHVSTQTPKFTRLAEKAGKFDIQSVAHQRNQCVAKINDLTRIIHPIPAAKVSEGGTQYESIHEGGEAEIIFTLHGTPPFTFTYTRSTVTGKKASPKVVETQTVSNIMESTYSIFSSEAGSYHVSYIADAYCSYPPLNASPDTKLITNG